MLPSHLPKRPDQQLWLLEIRDAFSRILQAYNNAARLIRNEDGDLTDLRARSQHLRSHTIPILEALEIPLANYPEWTTQCAEAIMSLAIDLIVVAQSLEAQSVLPLSKTRSA